MAKKRNKKIADDREPRQEQVRVAILGFGTVGSAVAKLLHARRDTGVHITHVFNRGVHRKKADWLGGDVVWTENFEDVLAPEVDAVLELVGNVELANEWVRRALAAGKHVITANKQLIARYGSELVALARKSQTRMAFGAAVAGVIPVIPAVLEGLSGDKFYKLSGILNGTCNYILSRMQTEGIAMDAAIKAAQDLGYAEADPSADLDGPDAGAKLAILSQVAMRAFVRPEDIPMRTIRTVQDVDFDYARQLGCTIRQISFAETNGKKLVAGVEPALVALGSPFGGVQSNLNLVAVYGQYGGRMVFSGAGAGGNPTAVAVVSDLLAIRRGHFPAPQHTLRPAEVTNEMESRWYLRFFVKDRPGIVAGIAGKLGSNKVNIDVVLQSPGHSKQRLPFVITTEKCPTANIRAAVKEISKFRYLVEPPLTMPILDEL